MIEQYLIIIGAAIILILGLIHMKYTFFSNKFLARDSNTVEKMKMTSPVLTRNTTMWKAWIGFNASHSLGVIFFGLVNIILGILHFEIYSGTPIFSVLNIATLFFYLFLSKKYWFKPPLIGVIVSLLCYSISFILLLK